MLSACQGPREKRGGSVANQRPRTMDKFIPPARTEGGNAGRALAGG